MQARSLFTVIPAKAGIQSRKGHRPVALGPCLGGEDARFRKAGQ
jgi:hypothetical protein